MNEQIRAIYAAVKFIEDHLKGPITVADIAATAGYSLYHFIRIFNQIVQHTPYDYLMRRRLTQAALDLLQSDRRVIDIALDFQFNNHETFTRAFGRLFRVPPSEWRDQGFLDGRVLMPRLTLDYLEYVNAPDFERPRILELDEIVLAGWMTSITDDPEAIPTLWRNLRDALRGLPLNLGRRDFWGLRVHPQIPARGSFYLAAIQIPDLISASPMFVTKILPRSGYICHASNNAFFSFELSLQYLYHTFLPKIGLSPLHPWEIEHFGEQREVLIPVKTKQVSNINQTEFKTGETHLDA